MDGDIIKYLKMLFLLFIILFIIYFFINKNTKNNPNKYSKGYVYIGSNKYLDSLKVNKDDILVEDYRNSNNPNMKIRNSYLITDEKIRKEIIQILYNYEKNHPSKWNRSIKSMEKEWEAHNTLYYLNYKKDHTADVDLDNNDENKYK